MSAYPIVYVTREHFRKIKHVALAVLAIFSVNVYSDDCSRAKGYAIMYQDSLMKRIKKCLPESIDSPACQDAMIMAKHVEVNDYFNKYQLCVAAGLTTGYEDFSGNMTKIVALLQLFAQKLNENPDLTSKLIDAINERNK